MKKTSRRSLFSFPVFVVVFGLCLLSFAWVWRMIRLQSIQSFEACQKAGFPIMEIFPPICKTPDNRTFTQKVEQQSFVVSGVIGCLPHKNTRGPITLECAFGLQDNRGAWYGLSDPSMQYIQNLPMGKPVTITGLYTADGSEKYVSVGVIEIQSVESK